MEAKEKLFAQILNLIETAEPSDYEHYIKPEYMPMQRGPENPFNQNRYSGMNRMFLTLLNIFGIKKSNCYGTFLQISGAGGKIKRGAKGIHVIYYSRSYYDTEASRTIGEKKYSLLTEQEKAKIKVFPKAGTNVVFSLDDVDGIDTAAFQEQGGAVDMVNSVEWIQEIEEFVLNTGCAVKTGETPTAYYNGLTDSITMPPIEAFIDTSHYYGTLFHELIHYTGNKLGRNMSGLEKQYSFEELVAETGAMILGAEFGVYENLTSSCAYIKSYLKSFEGSHEIMGDVFSEASRASNYLIGDKKNVLQTF